MTKVVVLEVQQRLGAEREERLALCARWSLVWKVWFRDGDRKGKRDWDEWCDAQMNWTSMESKEKNRNFCFAFREQVVKLRSVVPCTANCDLFRFAARCWT